MIRLKVDADIRRRGDVALVRDALATLIGAEGTAAQRRRGGAAQFTVDLDATAEAVLDSARAMSRTIEGSRWWIDVLDRITFSVWEDGRMHGFVRHDLSGWFRGEALLDLEEAGR